MPKNLKIALSQQQALSASLLYNLADTVRSYEEEDRDEFTDNNVNYFAFHNKKDFFNFPFSSIELNKFFSLPFDWRILNRSSQKIVSFYQSQMTDIQKPSFSFNKKHRKTAREKAGRKDFSEMIYFYINSPPTAEEESKIIEFLMSIKQDFFQIENQMPFEFSHNYFLTIQEQFERREIDTKTLNKGLSKFSKWLIKNAVKDNVFYIYAFVFIPFFFPMKAFIQSTHAISFNFFRYLSSFGFYSKALSDDKLVFNSKLFYLIDFLTDYYLDLEDISINNNLLHLIKTSRKLTATNFDKKANRSLSLILDFVDKHHDKVIPLSLSIFQDTLYSLLKNKHFPLPLDFDEKISKAIFYKKINLLSLSESQKSSLKNALVVEEKSDWFYLRTLFLIFKHTIDYSSADTEDFCRYLFFNNHFNEDLHEIDYVNFQRVFTNNLSLFYLLQFGKKKKNTSEHINRIIEINQHVILEHFYYVFKDKFKQLSFTFLEETGHILPVFFGKNNYTFSNFKKIISLFYLEASDVLKNSNPSFFKDLDESVFLKNITDHKTSSAFSTIFLNTLTTNLEEQLAFKNKQEQDLFIKNIEENNVVIFHSRLKSIVENSHLSSERKAFWLNLDAYIEEILKSIEIQSADVMVKLSPKF